MSDVSTLKLWSKDTNPDIHMIFGQNVSDTAECLQSLYINTRRNSLELLYMHQIDQLNW